MDDLRRARWRARGAVRCGRLGVSESLSFVPPRAPRCIERGEVRDDVDVQQLALALVGLHEVALVQHWGTGGAWPALDEIPTLVVRLFMEGAQS